MSTHWVSDKVTYWSHCNALKSLKSKVSHSLTHSLSEWQGHLLSCPGQLKKVIIFRRYQSSICKTKPCSVLTMLFIFHIESLFQWKTSCFARSRILSGGDAREFTMTVLRAPQQTYQTLPAAVSLWSLWQRRSWFRIFEPIVALWEGMPEIGPWTMFDSYRFWIFIS